MAVKLFEMSVKMVTFFFFEKIKIVETFFIEKKYNAISCIFNTIELSLICESFIYLN
jgi:hypothetical protein